MSVFLSNSSNAHKKTPSSGRCCKWRMRRDLNPRYESPRIHDFESRAFSLSATHPFFHNIIIRHFSFFRMRASHRLRRCRFIRSYFLIKSKLAFLQQLFSFFADIFNYLLLQKRFFVIFCLNKSLSPRNSLCFRI